MKTVLKEILSNLKLSYHLIFHSPKLALNETNYDEYWRQKRGNNLGALTPFQRQRLKWILPRIEDNSTILDIGCGDGSVLLYLMKHKNCKVIGADISDSMLSFVHSQGIRAMKFDLDSFEDIDNLEEVDHIILFEVLEHIRNPEKFLKLIEGKARKSIFFSLPNTGYFPYRIRMLLGRFVMQWVVHPGEHLRFWTYKDLKWWLKSLGYKDRTQIYIYEGIPLLKKLWGSLFGMAFVGEIKK